ncbi:hypothetical protein NPIL_548171 [Nephila pilipes]|uniref:Uncharacterized protein n=1 Tax=Nephila pilipes TaxID=299642 RepID=A0A8X6U848_NEPPI|nr:hypothetical protein NPIL_548171 [Nephila pilipes]
MFSLHDPFFCQELFDDIDCARASIGSTKNHEPCYAHWGRTLSRCFMKRVKISKYLAAFIVVPSEENRGTSWTIFKTWFEVVSSTNGWKDIVKVSQLIASLRRSAMEILQGIKKEG